MSYGIDHTTYRALYAKYYDGRDIGELLQLLEPIAGMNVVDLCGGDGRLALAALARGADDTVLVDAAREMVPPEMWHHPHVQVHCHPVENFLMYTNVMGYLYDRAVCRQAVNYWLNERTADNLAGTLKPGGIFAFNTFNQKPLGGPNLGPVKQYLHQDHHFVEVSWLVEDMVHHVQIRDGMPSHTSVFRWIAPEEFDRILSPHFTVHAIVRGKTTLYQCIRK